MLKSVARHGQSICKGVTMPNQQQENLDDIIISSSKKLNLKKLLLAIAVLLLVLIIIILVTKSLVQPEEKKMTSVILPPEPTNKPVMNKREEALFEDIPIPIEDEKKDTKIDEVIGKIKNKAKKEENPIYDDITIPIDEEETKEPTYSKPVSKKIEQPKPKPKPTPKPKPKKFTHGNYYIQVGAFFNYPPDKKFLNSIKRENLSYEIITATKNGKKYKKVVVGPYPSRKEAKSDLPIIKKRINQNAYITTKK